MPSNNGVSKRDDGAWELDAAAFLPEPEGYLKIGSDSYPIYSFLDLPVEDSMRVVAIGRDIDEAQDLDTRMQRSIDHLLMLNLGPVAGRENRKTLDRGMLSRLTPRIIVGLVVMANSIAAVPQKADESQSESVSPVLASAGSTAGPTTP